VAVHVTVAERRNYIKTSRPAWQEALPRLTDGQVTLRELRLSDAPSLLYQINTSAVLQFIARCPSTVQGFERFIRWTRDERRRGRHACYGIIPPSGGPAVGIIQIWSVERDFSTAEWGFAIGESFWGTGVFHRGAELFLDAVFVDRVFGADGVYRLEARAVVDNTRGNNFLARLGAAPEGILRGGFRQGNRVVDQVMWSILAPEWTRRTGV
jgi:ribosomal-protein-alanine N-acetyltransferase